MKQQQREASSQAFAYLIIISLFFLAITALSLVLGLGRIQKQYKDLATVIGRSIFQELIVVRRWNAQHGGVYVPVTEEFQPNPYLEEPLRDVTATNGMRLTKINPEHMTRLISELLTQDKGIRVHITSLILTDPANKPNAWEEDALKKFEKGNNEAFDIVGSEQSPEFTYMAPLKAEGSCLKCHAKQGYKAGDIRGGNQRPFFVCAFSKSGQRNEGTYLFCPSLLRLHRFDPDSSSGQETDGENFRPPTGVASH